jgi:hypothetical protein
LDRSQFRWRSDARQTRGPSRNPSEFQQSEQLPLLRVADIWTCYKQWRDKGAVFLTEPLDSQGWEWRRYMRDPDGYLIEVGQYTQLALDHFKKYAG